MLPKPELEKLLNFTEKLARNSGQILLKEQSKVKVVKYKDRQDIATSADLVSEEFVISEITKKFPGHSIMSEEKGEINKGSQYRWIIDPLDGTKEFIRGIPLWNVSIALEYKNDPIVAVVYRPFENSLYKAAKDLGSFLNDRKIKVSNTAKIEDSFVYCYLPSYHRQKENYEYAFKKLAEVGKKVYRLRALADENTALCWLAQGGIEAYLNLSNPPKWHDIAPGLLIAKEAGALISNSKGNQIEHGKVESLIVASNKEVREQIIGSLRL